jgi:hypothetical protein
MKRFGRSVLFVMLTMLIMIPAASGLAVAQDARLCAVARGATEDTVTAAYATVFDSGVSRFQFDLETDGDEVLTDDSSDHVLCEHREYDVLKSVRGNDLQANGPDIWISGGETSGNGTISGSGFTPTLYFGVDLWYIGPGFTEYEHVDLGYMRADGSFRTIDIFLFCVDRKWLGVTITSIAIGVGQDDAGGVYHYEEFPLSCP